MWEAPSHSKESKQRHRKGKKLERELRKLLFFPLFSFTATNSTENISSHNRSNGTGAFVKTASSSMLLSKRQKRSVLNTLSFRKAAITLEEGKEGKHQMSDWVQNKVNRAEQWQPQAPAFYANFSRLKIHMSPVQPSNRGQNYHLIGPSQTHKAASLPTVVFLTPSSPCDLSFSPPSNALIQLTLSKPPDLIQNKQMTLCTPMAPINRNFNEEQQAEWEVL